LSSKARPSCLAPGRLYSFCRNRLAGPKDNGDS
jgi:hypothetical protein